jgi:hypothetical protein
MPPNLTDNYIAVSMRLVRDTIAADPYPLSPRIKRLKAILANADAPAAPVERSKSLQAAAASAHKPSMLAPPRNTRRLIDRRI